MNEGRDGIPNTWVLLMAGGKGTRLWPKSRSGVPKQFMPMKPHKTLFQQTLERISTFYIEYTHFRCSSIGLLIVIHTEDTVFICHRNREQDIKLILELLQARGYQCYL